MAEPRISTLSNAKAPPHSNEAEQSLLGALMVSPNAWDRVGDQVTEDDFYRQTHRLVFRAISELCQGGQPCDVVTVAEWFDRHDQLEKVDGGAYLTMLANETPGPGNIAGYAQIVRERSILRQLIDIGTGIADNALQTAGRSSKELLEEAEQRIYAIADQGSRSQSGYVPIQEVMANAMDILNELQENEGELTGVPTGFSELDKRTAGLQKTDLIIVAARPSMGKCLSHDAELVLADGSVITMAEMFARQAGRVGTLSDALRIEAAAPSDYLDDGKKPVFEVETALGRRVETTLTHPFRTLQGWRPLSEIEVGDAIAVPRRLPFFGTETMRSCQIRLLAYLIGDGGLTGTTPRFTTTNAALRDDFTEAVEAFGGLAVHPVAPSERAPSYAVVTEHSRVADHRARFAGRLESAIASSGKTAAAVATELDVAPATISNWRHAWATPGPARLGQLATVLGVNPECLGDETLDSARRNRPNPLTTWLRELGVQSKGAHDKEIPPELFRLRRDDLALFLNRLFATDGWASVYASGQSQVGFASVNERLVRQVQHLLVRFGVISRVRQRWVRYEDARRSSWQLEITHAESLLAFVDEIGILGKEAAVDRVREALSQRRRQSNTDLIPVEVWQLLEHAKGAMSWAELARRAGVSSSNIHAHRRGLSRERLAGFARALGSDELLALAESEVYWDRIVSITALGPKQVYDLTVPGTHNFIANDICVHNTTFAMNIAEKASIRYKVPVAVFSMEMSDTQLVMRLFSSLGQIGQDKLRTGRLDSHDWVNLRSAMTMLKGSKMFIDQTPSLSPVDLRARARRMKREHDIGLIVIDYLQLMKAPGYGDNRTNEISEISRNLKALAKELNVPVIALSQLNRALEQRPDKRPKMADLRESGAIEQDADLILFIYRDEVYNEDSPDKGKAEIIIGKHRNGATDHFNLSFQGEFLRFRDFTFDHHGIDG